MLLDLVLRLVYGHIYDAIDLVLRLSYYSFDLILTYKVRSGGV